MIYQKRGKYCFRDENWQLHKFNTEQEAALAAGLGAEWEMDHGSEEAQYEAAEDGYETPEDDYEDEEVDTEE